MLGPKKGYVELLDEHLLAKSTADASQPRRYNPLRPSAAGKCAHELATEYAQYKGLLPTTQEVLQPDLQRIFSLGHSVEWNVLRAFEDSGLVQVKYRQQVLRFMQLSDGSWLEGSLDMTFFLNGEGGIGDVKSKKDRHSNFGASGWSEAWEGYSKMESVEAKSDKLLWIPDLPAFLAELKDPWLAPNFYQLNLYANAEFIKQSNITHAFVLQYNKNTSQMREMRFKPSEEVDAKVKAKFNQVHETVASANSGDVIQDRLKSLVCPVSSNCQYCWPDEAKRAYFSTLPPKKWPKDTSYLGQEGKHLEDLFKGYEEVLANQAAGAAIEQAIIKIMLDKDETKVRLANKEVWEAKFLKSPRPHHELRRSK
jgi:hypothetical protein